MTASETLSSVDQIILLESEIDLLGEQRNERQWRVAELYYNALQPRGEYTQRDLAEQVHRSQRHVCHIKAVADTYGYQDGSWNPPTDHSFDYYYQLVKRPKTPPRDDPPRDYQPPKEYAPPPRDYNLPRDHEPRDKPPTDEERDEYTKRAKYIDLTQRYNKVCREIGDWVHENRDNLEAVENMKSYTHAMLDVALEEDES